jgi:CHAD domain-containing protein
VDPALAHRLRIAATKLRYGLELLAPALPRRVKDALALVAPLQEVLGALHDVDVRVEMVERFTERCSPDERAAVAPLLARMRTERAADAESLRAGVREFRSAPALRHLRDTLA